MAKKEGNPEIKNGHIKIANELYEAILAVGFSARELKVVLSILRWTYGFNQKSRKLSYREIAKYAGIKDLFNVAKACQTLLKKRVLYRQAVGKRFVWGLNKYYRTWLVETTKESEGQRGDPLGQNDQAKGKREKPVKKPVSGVASSKRPKVLVKTTKAVGQNDQQQPRAKYTPKDTSKYKRTAKIICPRCKGKKFFRVPLGDGTIIKKVCGHCKGKGWVWRQAKRSQHS